MTARCSNINFLISLVEEFALFSKDHIEKCSESTGINFVLNFFNFIKFQPQIIDSLFAIAICFVISIDSKVDSKPSRPETAATI